MRISTDGFIDVGSYRRIRTPGYYEIQMDPMPEAEAVSFLLSHSFPGHRRIVRPMTLSERRKLKRASWADSVNERMSLVDLVWRGITRPVPPPRDSDRPELVQVARVDGEWAYPIYLDDGYTRVLPAGGIPLAEMERKMGAPLMDLGAQKVSA